MGGSTGTTEDGQPGTGPWDRLAARLHEARALAGDARAAYLAALHEEDPDVAREVRELLEHGDLADARPGFLDPGGWTAGESVFGESPGARIGPWRVLRRLGSGGMGDVHLATRDDGTYEQLVALKLVRADLDAPDLLERLRRERRVLARLVHPGIARLIDGGATPTGRPYLAMEFVDGKPLDEAVAALDPRDRVALLAEVCRAVASAHDEGVVHRDLKPSNILVTPEFAPKLLDFGIAKAVDGTAPDPTLLTRTGERLLTPRYAAPEQLRGEDVTTATDVHALGVLLYESLTGRSPFDEGGRSPREVEDAILARTPSRPSARLTGSWGSSRGDLDVVVMRALAKEPERRYPDAGALAADLERLLDGRPVLAQPDTVAYRVTSFVRRNRLLVGAVALVVLALTVGLLLALAANRDAVRQAARAEWTGYTASIAAAEAALRAGNTELARSQLDASPAGLRGWEWELLHGRLDRSRWRHDVRDEVLTASTVGGDGGLVAVTYAPNATHGPILLLFDAEGGGYRGECPLPDAADDVALTDDGGAVVATEDGLLRAGAGDGTRPLDGPPGRLAAAGGRAWVGDREGVVHEVPLVASRAARRSPPLGSAVSALVASADGRRVVAGLWSGDVVLLDGATLRPTSRLREHTGVVSAVAVDAARSRIASASIDGRVVVWDVGTDAPVSIHRDASGTPRSLAFSPAGDQLACRGSGGTVVLTDVTSGELVARLHGPAPGTGTVAAAAGPSLVAVDADGTLRSFSWDDVDVWTRRGCEFSNTVLFPDDERLVVASPDDRLRIWRGDTADPEVVVAGDPSSDAHGAVLLADGETVVSSLRASCRLRFWDLSSREVVREVALGSEGIRGLAVAGDGRSVWAAGRRRRAHRVGRDGEVRDLALAEERAIACMDLAVGPDEAWLAVLSGSGFLGVYDPTTGSRIASFERAEGVDGRLAVSPDGTRLVATAAWDALLVVDTGTWRIVATIPVPEGAQPVLALAFHPDGSRLVSGHADGTVRLWTTDSWLEVARLGGHRGVVSSVAFDPDGRTLASCDWSGEIRWWRP